jgi:predicted nuclease of restriction endonuclease-like (RecB) superfamily
MEIALQLHYNLEKQAEITPNLVFRDPCFLDFLGLEDTYSEKDLESAIVLNINL